ncbi:MAG: MATE family efflux transporter [Clostridia bacterium]|nr:MATE family efflux transporter [Clostridia bacterium]
MKRDNEFLATAPLGKLLFQLALPAVTAQIVNMLYNMVDRIYIGHIPEVGALALTGLGICMPILQLVSAFAALVSMGAAPRASIRMGEGDYEGAERILGNSFMLLLCLAAVITPILLFFGEDMLLAFGATENTVGYAFDYLWVYALGTVSVQLTLGLNAFITAQGFAKISMLTVLIGAIANIALDPLFIFAFHMGVKGAALATILSQTLSAIWVVSFLRSKKAVLRIKAKNMRLDAKLILPCVALGLSPFVMQSTESLLSVAFNTSLRTYGGDIAVGAMTILHTVSQLSLLPLQGLTQGAQPIASFNFGAKNKERVQGVFKLLLRCCIIYSMTLWAAAMLFPRTLAGVFTADAALLDYTAWAMRIFMAASGIFGIQIACQQTFIAIGNAKTSLFLAALRKLILLIPLIYILPLFFGDKVMAVYLAEPAADFIAVSVTSFMFARQFKKAMAGLEQR